MGLKSLKALIFFLIFIGFIGQLAIIIPSGLKYDGNLLFWSSHAHDGMWHIAVANRIQKGFPVLNPVFSGERLVNYHLFSDLPIALLNSITKIPSLTIYFQILPVIYSILLGYLAYVAGKEIGKSKATGYFSIISVYFIGSFGFIVTLIKNGKIAGESLFWASQVQSSIGNPPQILSNIFFLALIIYLNRFLSGKNIKKNVILIMITTIFASLSKIYAVFAVFPALGILSIYRLIRYKKVDLLLTTVCSAIVTFALYLPFTKGAENFLVYEPLWYARRLFSDPGRIGIKNFDLTMQHYQSLHSLKSKIGFARYDILGLTLMFFGNLGVRAIGLFSLPFFLKNKNHGIGIFLLSAAVLSFVFPNIFLQKGVATNSSQTLQYMLLTSGILFAVACPLILKKLNKLYLKTVFIFIVFLFGLPTQIGLLYEFYSRPAYTKISREEIRALNYVKQNTSENSVILTPSYNQYLDTKTTPPPIWDWFDTSYVAALSGKQLYFADYEQVDIMGYDYNPTRDFERLFFNSTSPDITTTDLKQKGISLIYFPTPLSPKRDLNKMGLTNIYSSSEVEVWSVN